MNELNRPTTDHPEEFVGSQLGKYILTQYIGRGGFGTVYLATHAKLGTTRAIKVLNDATTDLIKEARKQATVQHPNIVRIDDLVDEITPNFIVMEYMPDGDLTKLITKTTPEQAIEIMQQIMQGLSHIHANKLTHLDLKPTNILLNGETAKISDFGLAKTFGNYATRLRTTQSAIGGTPDYMPPEQTQGITAPTNDIYSTGIIFYQLLTGKLPQETGFEDVQKLNARVSEALDILIMKAISQSPRKRQQSAQEILEELKKIGKTQISIEAELLQDTTDHFTDEAPNPLEPDTFSDLLAIPTEPLLDTTRITYDENPTDFELSGDDELPKRFQNRIGTKEEPVPNPTIIVPTHSTTLGGIKVYEHDAAIVRQILATAGRKNLNGIGITNTDHTDFDIKPLMVVKDERIIRLSLTGIPITSVSEVPELTELKELNIDGTKVTDISPLAITEIERLHAHIDLESLVPTLLMEKLAELKYAYDKEDDAILKALPQVRIVKGFHIGERPTYRPTVQTMPQWPYLQVQNGKPNFRGILNPENPTNVTFELTTTARQGNKIAGIIDLISQMAKTRHYVTKTYFAGTMDTTQTEFTQILPLGSEFKKIKFTGTKQGQKWKGTYVMPKENTFEMQETE